MAPPTPAQDIPSDTSNRRSDRTSSVGSSFDIPINPDRYLIRPGERLLITVIGAGLPAVELAVNSEGKIIDSKIGVVDVAGLTLSRVRAMLIEPLSRQYRAAEIVVSIQSPRPVSIRIVGAIRQPGTYSVFTSGRVSDVIALAGGLRPEASSRRIQLTGGPKSIGVDLDLALFAADADANPPVYGGTTIQVPARTPNSVRVLGEVLKPGEIELVDGDTWEIMVSLAGGALPTGDPTSAFLSNDSARLLDKSTRLKPFDVLVVPIRSDLLAERGLFVTGAVKHPGGFAYATDVTVDRLLDLAGGPTGVANSARIVIFRRPDRMEPGADTLPRIPISNLRTADGKLRPIALRPFDSVYVPIMIGVVRVSGRVQRPGFVPFEPGKSASYYIGVAGDYFSTANRVGVVIRNRVTGEMISSALDALVQDGDEVIVTVQGGVHD